MQLVSCKFAAVRGPSPAAWTAPRPSLTTTTTAAPTKKNPAAAKRCAASRRDGAEPGGGRLVDEDMVVLRRRIHEMRAAERSWEPPAEWAAWEEWYGTYDADMCHLVGARQKLLSSARPGVGVGILAALALAVPASAFVLVSHLVDAWRGLLSNLPH